MRPAVPVDLPIALPARRPRRPWPWLIMPALAFLAVMFLYPVGRLLWLSVEDPGGGLTAASYVRLFGTSVYVQILITTFKIAGWTTLVCVAAGYPVAYLLSTTESRWRQALTLLVLLPFWTSFLVRTFAWIVLLGHNGVINTMLRDAGLTDDAVPLLYNFTGVMIGMANALMPIAVLAMMSVMRNIDANLTKAASTLGARGGQAFWRVYFPLSLPGVAAAGLLVFITALGFFITPALLGGRREIMITQVIIEQVQLLLNWPFAAAISLLLLASALVIFFLYNRVLGMSTVVEGTSGAGHEAGGRPNRLGRGATLIGARLIAALGWTCDRAAALVDRVVPVPAGRPPRPWARWALWTVALLVVAFLALPAFFVIPVSFSEDAFIQWPPRGFTLGWYETYLDSPQWTAATVRSFVVGLGAGVLAMLIGTPAAFALVRRPLPAKAGLLAFILSPLIIPRIIIAVALFYMYARVGLVGTSVGLVLGHTVLAIPYVVVTVMAILKTYDERLDQAAATLGASTAQTLRRVTFPLLQAGLVAAFLFAFITSFDDVTIALFVTAGFNTTLPKHMWDEAILQVTPTLAAASTLLLVFVTATVLVAEYLRQRMARV